MRLRIRPRPPEYWLAFGAVACYVVAFGVLAATLAVAYRFLRAIQ